MSSDAPGPRPRQVTIGGWVVAVASTVLVVSVFDTMANLHTIDTRDRLTDALTSGSLKDLGITVDSALSLIRGALFVAGVAAAVTGILGIFVLQRHQAARIVLTAAAVPVVLTAPFAGGILGVVIGGAAALLWTEPARDWFAGRPARQREEDPTPRAWPAADRHDEVRRPAPLPAPPRSTPSAAPRPMHGWGQAGAQVAPPPVLEPPAAAWPPPRPLPAGVPYAVRLACSLTWVFSGLTAAAYLVVLVGLAVNRSGMLDLVRDNPSIRDTSLSEDQLVGVLVAMSALVILWCLVACLLAVLTWRRHGWARVLLLVSVGVAAVVELVALPYSLLNLAGCVAALVLLLRAPVRAWFAGGGSAAGWAPPDPGSRAPGSAPPPQGPSDHPSDRPSGEPPVW